MKRLFTSISLLILFTGWAQAADIIPGATYKITTYSTGNKTLSVKNSSLDNSADIVCWTETNVNAQRWRVTADQTGEYYFLTNVYTGKVLYMSGSVASGVSVKQYTLTNGKPWKWTISPVDEDGFDDCFYITQATLLNNNPLYLEVTGETEGATTRLYTQKTGENRNRQIWKMEVVTETPNRFTASVRDEMMQGWKNQYYKSAATGYVLGNGGWWGDAEMFEIVLDAYETTGDAVYKDMFEKLNRNFIARNNSDWSSNEYNDDIAWMVITTIRAYLMFGDQTYLSRAKSNFDKMYQRALLPSGMLRWKERDSNTANGTNSCINGPAEVAACYLAIATGDDGYYTKAKDLYALQRQYLYVPATGQVYDSFTWNNGAPTNYNQWASTYNQGTFLGAAIMLYNRYGDEQYKEDAQMIMKFTREHLCDKNGVVSVCGSGDDLQGFKGILMRYVRRLIVDLQQIDYVDWMQLNACHAYNNRNSYGVSWTAWWEKSKEDFTFDSKNYRNDPFGPSTAVSAAMNAPLDKELIIKDAFSRIEAENFNYLKGVFVEQGDNPDDTTPYLANIKNDFWTAYNQVSFGDYEAKAIEFRVSNPDNAGSIEVRLGSPTGTLIGTIDIPTDADWKTISSEIIPVDGIKNIYLVFKGNGNLFQLNYFRFIGEGNKIQERQALTGNVKIYPNPVKEYLYVDVPQNGQMNIFNLAGKSIYSGQVQQGITPINVIRYEKGSYIIKINGFDSIISKKFIKK
jgi:predicted alpha-1,6-mannanase (GH76 family)